MAKILIGTSGWTYPSWKKKFYPAGFPQSQYLQFYSQYFPITEVNYSFYHLPSISTYKLWEAQAPEQFLFALKASRFITHIKRLKGTAMAWQKFLTNASYLQSHLGPLLFQLPSSFHLDINRLNKFLAMLERHKLNHQSQRLVFEFRHQSWFIQDVYDLLGSYGAALCIADSGKYPRQDIITTDFAYFRFHGRSELFASNYSEKELKMEAGKIKKLLKKNIDVYAFFNNDAKGYAVKNALTLKRLLDK